MKKWMAAICLLWAASAAVSHAQDKDPERSLRTLADRLYFNVRTLDEIYGDMHQYAWFSMAESDRQLDAIQKAAMLVGQSKIDGYYQWRLLSVLDYIREEMRGDYMTLRLGELRKARSDAKSRVALIRLYSAGIERPPVRQSIEEAAGVIEGTIYMYEELERLIEPMANTAPFPRRLD